jgi:hypothetical protein
MRKSDGRSAEDQSAACACNYHCADLTYVAVDRPLFGLKECAGYLTDRRPILTEF